MKVFAVLWVLNDDSRVIDIAKSDEKAKEIKQTYARRMEDMYSSKPGFWDGCLSISEHNLED